MPIKIPSRLPATEVLQRENIFVMTEERALSQDIRPLRILMLNLMPTKVQTETQLARLLGNTPLQVELELMHTSTHKSRNTSADHLLAFYKTFDEVKHQKYDGLVITGAPVEHLPFEEVEYWQELCDIMAWSKTHVFSTFHICWAAQAALYYHHGINKYPLEKKLFGVFPHTVDYKNAILMRGFDEVFMVPHSRHTTIRLEDVSQVPALKVLSTSREAGIYALMTERGQQVFVTGHSEYDARTLQQEYLRDKNAGLPIEVPVNYFPDDDDSQPPMVSWRSHANLLFINWLNYFVYQITPYNISEL